MSSKMYNDPVKAEKTCRKLHFPFWIDCAVCGNVAAAYYDSKYKGYLAYCHHCEDQWKLD